jgi:hypothetical protein
MWFHQQLYHILVMVTENDKKHRVFRLHPIQYTITIIEMTHKMIKKIKWLDYTEFNISLPG